MCGIFPQSKTGSPLKFYWLLQILRSKRCLQNSTPNNLLSSWQGRTRAAGPNITRCSFSFTSSNNFSAQSRMDRSLPVHSLSWPHLLKKQTTLHWIPLRKGAPIILSIPFLRDFHSSKRRAHCRATVPLRSRRLLNRTRTRYSTSRRPVGLSLQTIRHSLSCSERIAR